MARRATIYTIGHSTRTLDELLAMLTAHGVQRLVDVRTVPRSRRNPQFNREALPPPLRRTGIAYGHMPGLGGLRRPVPDSVNTGWRNASFRGYADYMQTDAFHENLDALLTQARARRVAIMCAEAVPWRCHRSLIADALAARGVRVEHIMTARRADPHAVTSFALIRERRVTYPEPGQEAAEAQLPLEGAGHHTPTTRKVRQRLAAVAESEAGRRAARQRVCTSRPARSTGRRRPPA